jgi:KDO2-lipid IV(A) lauroyltransferase
MQAALPELNKRWEATLGEPIRYRILVEDIIRPEEYAGRSDAVPAITQRFTSALERIVRRHPEQYFWLHRRWKHQPVTTESPHRNLLRAAA